MDTVNQVHDDITATVERSRLELIQENDRLLKNIEELNLLTSKCQDRLDAARQELRELRDTVHDWLMEQLDSGEWSEDDQLEQLAQGVGVDLTREYQITVLVEYTATIQARSEDAAQEIVDELNIPELDINGEYAYGEITDTKIDQA